MVKLRPMKEIRQMCQDTNVDLNVSGIRKLVLHVTDGLCPASAFMNVNTGELFDKATVCRVASSLVMTGGMHNVGPSSKSMEAQVARKIKNEVFWPLECVASLSLQLMMWQWERALKKSTSPVPRFRKRLSETLGPSLRGIHLFKWDGTPRASMRDIDLAVCHYAPSKKGMSVALKALLGTVGTAALVGGGGVLARKLSTHFSPTVANEYKLPPGAKIVRMEGDGNCLFRALGDQIDGNPDNHGQIRQDVCKYISEHPDLFLDAMVPDSDEPPDEDPLKKLKARVSQMSSTSDEDGPMHGDFLEVGAAARLYGVNMIVYYNDGRVYKVRDDVPSPPARTFHLAYCGNGHNGHFDSVRV